MKTCPRFSACRILVELNIGHSIVSRAVLAGLETAVKEMLRADEKLSRVKGARHFADVKTGTCPEKLNAPDCAIRFHFGDERINVALQAERHVVAQFGNRQQPPPVFRITNRRRQVGICPRVIQPGRFT